MAVLASGYYKAFPERSFTSIGFVPFVSTAFGCNYWNGDWKVVCTTTNMSVDLRIYDLVSFYEFGKKLPLMPFFVDFLKNMIFQKLPLVKF